MAEGVEAAGVLPTILVVDDHPPNLRALQVVLEPLGYPIATASSGEHALDQAVSQNIAMIIMDVQMAGLDGYETIARLRRREPLQDVPVIFLTAIYDEPAHVHRGYALGAVDYITKPFDPNVLRAKVRALVSLYLRGQRAERARSEEADRVKNLFLGAVGHDLRNPLNSILVACSMLSSLECSEELHRRQAERIQRSAQWMNQIIEDILDLTRGQFSDGIPVTLRPTDLGEVCASVVEEFRVAHPRRELSLEVGGDVRGHWDASRLVRVVSNLVGNAIQHGHDGPVRVRVLDKGERVALVVHNRGEPIPEANLSRLFEPFQSGQDASSVRLGLGLYIVREVARAHGGDVSVTSTPADGTSFTVSLPRLG